MNATHFPQIVQELAASAGGTPIAWKEYDDHFAIVMEDGRKLTFQKARSSAVSKPRLQQTLDDFKEHVGEDKPKRKSSRSKKD